MPPSELKQLDFSEYFKILESWAKQMRLAKNDPQYRDLTKAGREVFEDELFEGR